MFWRLFVLPLLHTECALATTLAAWSQWATSDAVSALQQQPSAVAPPGDVTGSAEPSNTTSADWECVPPFDFDDASGSNAEISKDAAGLSGLPIQTFTQRKRVCVSMAGYLRGGLANSMAVVNTVMDYAIRNKQSFVMPQILPIDHDLGDDFAFMFGSNPVCSNRTVPVWSASCPSGSLMGKRPPKWTLPGGHNPCNVSEQWVHNAHKHTTDVCDCQEFLVVETARMDYHFDYSRTATKFSRMYWKNAPGTHSHSTHLEFPLLTAMHVRLGDVKEMGIDCKYLSGEDYAELAMALTSFINAACLNVSILTDGRAGDKNIRAPRRVWISAGARNTQVLDITTPATVSLNTMAKADILIGGPSGFPRLAAVLGNAQVKLFIDDKADSHPLHYLPGVSGVGPDILKNNSVKSAAIKALEQNKRVAEVATACTRWLARKRSSSD